MLFRILNWFRKDRDDVYHPKERLVFSYFDGERLVRADPLALYKRVMQHGPELSIHSKVAASPSKGAPAAMEKLVNLLREIFQIKPLFNSVELNDDKGGGTLGDVEVKLLLDKFLVYCANVKKNSSLSRTLSTSTAGSKTTSRADRHTPPTSDSGSTDVNSSTEKPVVSPSVAPSPSDSSTPDSNSSVV